MPVVGSINVVLELGLAGNWECDGPVVFRVVGNEFVGIGEKHAFFLQGRSPANNGLHVSLWPSFLRALEVRSVDQGINFGCEAGKEKDSWLEF